MNIQDLINAIQQASNNGANITINVNQPSLDAPVVAPAAPVALPDTDFAVDDRVKVFHVRHNSEQVTVNGTVIEVQQHDDKGWYTRILGDNGKHYRTGLTVGSERLGSTVIAILDDDDDEVDF